MFMFWFGGKIILPFLTELLLIRLVFFGLVCCFVFFFHYSIIWSIFFHNKKQAACKQNIPCAFLQSDKLLKNYYLQFRWSDCFTRSLGRGEHKTSQILRKAVYASCTNLDAEPLYTFTNLPVLWQIFLGNSC